jgi:MFS family permease
MFANAVFFIGSALCGAAQSMNMLIIGRAVQGIGGSGILTLSLILVADIVPLRNRGKYQSLTAFVYALASVFGPLLGGVFSDNVTWRWAFYINLPVGAVGMALLVVFLHMNRPKNLSLKTAMRGLDYAGIGLLIGSIIMILLGLNWGADAKYEWNSAVILSLLIIGVLVMVAFLVNEWKLAANPIIPLRLLGTLSLGMTYFPVFVDGFVSMGLLFFLPLYSQAVHGASAIESGVELLPYVCMSSVVAIIVGQLTSRWGTYKEFIIFGWVAGVLSTGLMVLFDENTGRGRMVGILLVQGVSLGAVVNTQLLAVHAQLKNPADMALATSLWTLLRTFGGVFGVALGGTLVQNSLSTANANKYAQNIKGIADLSPELRAPVLKAFVEGLQKFFILLAALSGLALLASFLIKKVAMDGSDDINDDTAGQGNVQELEDARQQQPVEKLNDSLHPLSTV